ncbi:MAG: hypothetical protein RhofKO_15400 [Rhodothermales bacterium]
MQQTSNRYRALVACAVVLLLGGVARVSAQAPPKVLVHYMPWYQTPEVSGYWGWHWTMNHFNPDAMDADGRRSIASHTYPMIGPYDSSDPDVLEYHTLLMAIAGIDGVIVDWYGTSTLYDYPVINTATQHLFEEIEAAGLQFAICYEDATLARLIESGRLTAGEAVSQAQADLRHVRDAWTTSSAYLTHDEQPVILNFGPQHLHTSGEWQAALSVFDEPPVFVTEDRRVAPVGAGAFPWPPMWASSNGVLSSARMQQYLSDFYRKAAPWPLVVGSAFPGFHDIYEQAGVGASYGFLDAQEGATLHSTVERALAAEVPILQLVTWNDFGEGTTLEPTREYGYRYLEYIQTTVQSWRTLPYGVDDLSLPEQVYAARKAQAGQAEVQAQLDVAVEALRAGDPTSARAILATIAVGREAEAPSVVNLVVHPNPASSDVSVHFELEATAHVQVEVYDLLGRRVARLANGWHAVGAHTLSWVATRPSGLYIVRLQAGEAVQTRRLIVQ